MLLNINFCQQIHHVVSNFSKIAHLQVASTENIGQFIASKFNSDEGSQRHFAKVHTQVVSTC